jgi:rod shape-determining protein MreD
VRGLVSLAAVTVAVVCQLTIVDRIAFPGGAGPDLVLILVAALALASGPLTGALTGFWAGLALDVAPPGSHFVGQDALVFCLVGYLCGLLADEPSADGVNEPGHTALFEIVVTVAGALCGEALAVLLGVMLSDPRVTWPAITHVLPVAALYDVLACPFVLYAAAAALRLTGTRAGAPKIGAQQIGAKKTGPAPSTPRFRLSGGTAGVRAPAPRREPRLKLGQGSLPGGGLAAFATGGTAAAKVRFSGRRREGVFGGSLLGGSVFRRPAPGFGRGPLNGGTLGKGTPGRATLSRGAFGKGTLGRGTRGGTLGGGTLGGGALGRRTAGGTLAPRFSRGGALRRLAGALRRPARPRSPGKGWLRRTSTPTLRRSALGRSTLGRSALGRRRTLNLRMPRQKTAKRRRFR